MSGTQDSAVPLTDAERMQVRRYCGYPMYGNPNSVGFQLWRFMQAYGLLEFRMTNAAADELTQIRTFLSTIAPLETVIATASDNLDTDRAAVWWHNKNEVQDRVGLYNYWRGQLCLFMGIPRGPGLQEGRNSAITV